MKQAAMFTQGEDTPLFSGTVMRVTVAPFEYKEQPLQARLPAHCPLCLDTGIVDGQPCICTMISSQGDQDEPLAVLTIE